ncbi:MAG: CobD/CbiB family protein [Hydrogenophaga sp.]|jgi:adenosylcobinamide-phosphate synthase|uniref:CobD/CbiB family protein n=1 Tax=Hydrogenophaga sp. TaxID=1904254 RepID=UPI00261580B6|nr:CobD/CbiB family protein [Hydrogenophaga sp.]MDD3785592.1 CobD/CbiB family protein [Hydrogenophaga sp.]MDX9968875.1 CobD/CbiB family protein [Hydrogenophaga sp.]
MSFFAVLMALLLEQVRPVGYDNPVHALLRSWARSAGRHLDTGEVAPAWVAWILAVVLPALVAAIVHAWLAHLSVLLALAWLVLVLYLTLGFRQFSHHFTAIRHAMETGDEVAARQHLARWLRADVATLPRTELLRHVIEHSVLSAHRHVFGVLLAFFVCWFLGLGPAGAVAYRMADYVLGRWKRSEGGHAHSVLARVADQAWRVVDYVPARMTALAFAIVGNFEEAVASWRSDAGRHGPAGDGIVLAATSGAINVRLRAAQAGEPDTGNGRAEPQIGHLASAVGLVWRSVVLWMLFLLLATLAGWRVWP